MNARVAAVEGAEAIAGFTPLHFAAYWGADDVARLLVAKDADVNARNKDGATPLHGAAYGANLEIARLLVAKGADVNAKGAGVDDAARYVLFNKRRFLSTSRVADRTPLHQAAFNGHTEVARLLVDEGAAVDPKDAEGETPLHRAASDYGNVEVARLLLDEVADVGARCNLEFTPLHFAAWTGDAEVARLLAAEGADVEAKAAEGETPLHLAARGLDSFEVAGPATGRRRGREREEQG